MKERVVVTGMGALHRLVIISKNFGMELRREKPDSGKSVPLIRQILKHLLQRR